jgi:hypothetical protein
MTARDLRWAAAGFSVTALLILASGTVQSFPPPLAAALALPPARL